ncbi:putative zinc-binding protein [Rhodanobacter sp. FW106-PBR-LB-2-11]|uniref:putative zinc-binding protein n=2 Tax=Pseudomonadota TaxID=1224 RepID=UPI0034E42AA0
MASPAAWKNLSEDASMSRDLPLVYSCSGCSSAAQMANHLALRLDRAGAAEMSCIAGVGGGVTGLVRTAQGGRRILALDGCVLKCAAACLANAGVVADTHLVLSDHGVKKRKHADFDPGEALRIYQDEVLPAALALHPGVADDAC